MADQAEKLRELMSGAPGRERRSTGAKAAGLGQRGPGRPDGPPPGDRPHEF